MTPWADKPERSYMYISIKELSGKNGFLVEWRIRNQNLSEHYSRFIEVQKFFPTKSDIVKGLPAILSEAI